MVANQWADLLHTARACAEHGWPIVPGSYQLSPTSTWLGKDGNWAFGLEPVTPLWTTIDPATAAEWWAQHPYSLLITCGSKVDVLEVAGSHGPTAARALRRHGAALPAAVSPFGNWLFFVCADPDTARDAAIPEPLRRWHSETSWLPLPPTICTGANYRWHHTPAIVDWNLPPAREVYQVLRTTTRASRP